MSIIPRFKHKFVGWFVEIPIIFSIALGLFINMGLIFYSSATWIDTYVIPFLILIVVYANLIIVYLHANVKRIQAVEAERSRADEALKSALAAEQSRVDEALKLALAAERSRTDEVLKSTLAAEQSRVDEVLKSALAAERSRVDKSLMSEEIDRTESLARRDKKWYQSFSRILTPEDEQLFCTKWGEILDVSLKPSYIRYLQHRLNQVEDLCLGRLAGTVQDAILRTLVASIIKDNTIRLLEIGTLFGVNSIFTYDVLSHFFEQVSLTLVDPLDGYYGSNKVDIVTGMPVTRSVLQHNLDCLNIPPDDYTIIQAYSTDAAAIQKAQQQRYNFIFIDGDHSYEGIKADFELYSPMLEMGGYLVFDDYQRDVWPEVGQFVDEVVLNAPSFECMGTSWHTIVFRKKYHSFKQNGENNN
ncbi:MAG: class I SAM-dependent methyltransferase [Anaerolineae bacterium]|nr:class I SAM-dependent methyltransferase [Anaerolineae bacterium]